MDFRKAFIFLAVLACLSRAGPVAYGGEAAAQAEGRRRAAVLADIGRLKLELGTPQAEREALEALKQAVRLDAANIRVRYWLGAAYLRSARSEGDRLSPEAVGRAGLEFEAVFKLSSLDRSSQAQDLRRRAIAALDACTGRLPAGERRFGRWWKARRAELVAEKTRSEMVHTVARGDTVATVARKYYGDVSGAARITKANPGIDPRRIRVGQRLRVPGVPLDVAQPKPHLDRIDRELVRRLRSAGAAGARRVAAERLGRRDCLAAVPFLLEGLRNDPSRWVRAECAGALGRLGDGDAEPALCAALGTDSSARCRREAAAARGRLGGRGALSVLLAALSDRSPSVAAASARSLGRLRFAEASGPLTASLSAGSEAVRRAAAQSLGDLAAVRRLSAEDFRRIKSLASGDSGAARSAALLTLADADAGYLEKLLPKALKTANPLVRRAGCEAAATLASRGGGLEKAVVERLVQLFTSADPATRFGAALAVARARRRKELGRRALVVLVGMLDEPRTISWSDAEPRTASGLAESALAEITGRRLPDSAAWKKWLERN